MIAFRVDARLVEFDDAFGTSVDAQTAPFAIGFVYDDSRHTTSFLV
jgi:hypothetical protein